MLGRVIVGTALAFVVGVAAHEGTHWLAARATDSPVERVSLVPPLVSCDPATDRADMAVKAAPILAAVPVTVVALLAGEGRSLPAQLAVGAFIAGYVPYSASDWQGIRALIASARAR